MTEWLPNWVAEHALLSAGIYVGGLLVAAAVVYWVVRFVLVRGIRTLVRHSRVRWDDALVEAKVFTRLAHVPPALVVFYGVALVPDLPEAGVLFVQRVAVAIMIAVTTITINSFLTAVNAVYEANPEYRHRPIKGYLQLVKIILSLVTAIIVIAALMDRSPWFFLSGLGAMTAVLLLIFKDTILSVVASVQIASNDMIHVGDWVEMPQAGVDGDVIDVALHTVKVQNWDKTISTIPTHKFIEESFKNWRGMTLSGGRRIKRSVSVDVSSVRFLTEDEIDSLSRWSLLSEYLKDKRAELAAYNAQDGRDAQISADIRRLTNLGTLRAYLGVYLRRHPSIHSEGYTLIVRQLSPGPTGVPIEIYCFSNDLDWANYEGIQSDLFDHILAIAPEFGLRIFQSPSGHDLTMLGTSPPQPHEARNAS